MVGWGGGGEIHRRSAASFMLRGEFPVPNGCDLPRQRDILDNKKTLKDLNIFLKNPSAH
jgi:hypothetical protein